MCWMQEQQAATNTGLVWDGMQGGWIPTHTPTHTWCTKSSTHSAALLLLSFAMPDRFLLETG